MNVIKAAALFGAFTLIVGISAKAIDLTLGVVKFPFMTKVGGGPFVTELGGIRSENYCSQEFGNRKDDEKNIYGGRLNEMMNSSDDFEKGIALRMIAGEYGATTARPRRIGWTDAVAAKYAVRVNGPMKLILTKADALENNDFNICYNYIMSDGSSTQKFVNDSEVLRKVIPEYKIYKGYSDIRGETQFEKLPSSLTQSIIDFEKFVGAEVSIVSTGPEMIQTALR